nr:transketolase [Chlamydiales bacterium]
MDHEKQALYQKIATTVRTLSIDAIEKANSGHPGLPMGCAELGSFLFSEVLHYDPQHPLWMNRDRFILSAGHGSMLLYSLLHLSGYPISLDDLKNFRQLNSKTPGHPEFDLEIGVEATTGPLGHGIGNAVGLALSMKILASKFNTDEHSIIDNKIYCLAGDGCMMEGAASEASSLAGHLGLNNLVLIYDQNDICLDGPTSECFTEDVQKRYESYGFEVLKVNGNDFNQIEEVFSQIKNDQKKPILIMAHTIIGKGSPHKQGSNSAHGSPLGEEEAKLTKKLLGQEESFFVPNEVNLFFEQKQKKMKEKYDRWKSLFEAWQKKNPELFSVWEKMRNKEMIGLEELLEEVKFPEKIAGRVASSKVIQKLAQYLPYLYSGSADLSISDKSNIENSLIISSKDFSQRNIKFGVREFAMGTICNGLAYSQMILPLCGTFLTFSDYMRNAIRIAAMAHL